MIAHGSHTQTLPPHQDLSLRYPNIRGDTKYLHNETTSFSQVSFCVALIHYLLVSLRAIKEYLSEQQYKYYNQSVVEVQEFLFVLEVNERYKWEDLIESLMVKHSLSELSLGGDKP